MKDDKLDYLEKKKVDELAEIVKFEVDFFKYISGSEKFNVLPIPDSSGKLLTSEEKLEIVQEAESTESELLYYIQTVNNDTILFGIGKNAKFGIIPATDFATHS